MKFTVYDIKLFKKMVGSADDDDEMRLSKRLHKKQPHFCNIIDQVKIDPRCSEAHLFCTLFCSLALDHAERVTEDDLNPFSESRFHNIAHMIVQRYPKIGKRAYTYPDRVKRHILKDLEFDEEDNDWLIIMISTFLTIIEMISIDDDLC
ncbi:MAG: hypothetical protein U9R75_04020 [Candidatus Thermoplasmatota archaeon]|nr:hypothetical protein [Candidatus Thermoplasmatota archaeon]